MLDQTLPKQNSADTNSRTYIAIDLKSFYASVECVDRGLDPLTTKLVVADITRTDKTVCLAVSPALKALGVGGRDRLFQVYKKVPRGSFIIAPPRMQKYVDVSTSIFGIYAEYLAPTDIHIYSIDEAFLDVTSYLQTYQMTAHQLARTIVKDVLGHTGITATVGIGENLYLAKVAMDIVAKQFTARFGRRTYCRTHRVFLPRKTLDPHSTHRLLADWPRLFQTASKSWHLHHGRSRQIFSYCLRQAL